MMMMMMGLVSSESDLDIRDKNSMNTYHGYNSVRNSVKTYSTVITQSKTE